MLHLPLPFRLGLGEARPRGKRLAPRLVRWWDIERLFPLAGNVFASGLIIRILERSK